MGLDIELRHGMNNGTIQSQYWENNGNNKSMLLRCLYCTNPPMYFDLHALNFGTNSNIDPNNILYLQTIAWHFFSRPEKIMWKKFNITGINYNANHFRLFLSY